MKIAIAHDSPALIEVLKRLIEGELHAELAWTAQDGREALARCENDQPDLLLMQVLLPSIDGVAATREIMQRWPCAILLISSSGAASSAKVFEAMGLGAIDVIDSPRENDRAGGELWAHAVSAKIRKLEPLISSQNKAKSGRPTPAPSPAERPFLIAIGASTGGPKALVEIFSRLPADLNAAIVVAQHVDEHFAAGLATWLAGHTALAVRVANEGGRPRVGEILIAATNDHLIMRASGTLAYTAEPEDYPFRPSVDEFFQSLAKNWKGPAAAVVLTGMSSDGAEGLLSLRRRGWHTIAQDRATSVVYAMPKAAAQLGAAMEILPIGQIGDALVRKVRAAGRTS